MEDALGNPITETEIAEHLDSASKVNIFGGVTSDNKLMMLSGAELHELAERAERFFESAVASGSIK